MSSEVVESLVLSGPVVARLVVESALVVESELVVGSGLTVVPTVGLGGTSPRVVEEPSPLLVSELDALSTSIVLLTHAEHHQSEIPRIERKLVMARA